VRSLYRKILACLSRSERRRFRRIYSLTIGSSFLEVLGVSSIMPFIAVLSNPGLMDSNRALHALRQLLPHLSISQFTLALGIFALTMVLVSNAVLGLTNWKLMEFTYGLAHSISSRLLARYLHATFARYVLTNTADAKKNVLDEVVQTVNSATVPFMQALAKLPVVVMIVALVIAADPRLAPLAICFIGGLYWAVYALLRAVLTRIGRDRVHSNEQRFRAAHEVLDAFTDIRILAKGDHYQRLYDDASYRFARAQALSMTLSITPKYAMEALAFGGILLIAIYMLATGHSLAAALPIITLYAVAAYRLMPSLQIIFAGLSKARFAEPGLDLLLAELRRPPDSTDSSARTSAATHRVYLRHELRLRNVSYAFPGQAEARLHSISLSIPARTILGIAGPTGSGKSTIANIILGLLPPSSGTVEIDGQPLTAATVPAWQRSLGYVSQQIYISDASVAENIAFGVSSQEIDYRLVEAAAKAANIHDFVTSEMPAGYATIVGDRGARLSGGQRQRIAIARALYRDPDVLVFDEATSALDTATEGAVMDALNSLATHKTVILIAHRLNTLRHAHSIVVLDNGRIIDLGRFDELVARGCLNFPPDNKT
jgi:ABC-type multidrug transport system fused ATPase/permease subunit